MVTMRGPRSWRSVAPALLVALALVAPGPAASAVELTMYYPIAVGGPIPKLIDGMIADFEKAHPGITVKAVYAGNYDDTRTKALAALRAGQPVQLSVLFSIDVFELIDQDAIVPFDELLGPADRAWLDGFYPALMENSRVNGKTWGIPFQRSTIVLYWNKDAFREAGLDPNRPPATWGEMLQMSRRLVRKDAAGNITRYGIMIPSTGYPYWMFQALARQNGEVLMNQDGTRTFFDRPAVVEALEFWRDLGGRHGVMPRGTVEWGTLRAAFLEGKTAMMWHTTGNLTPVRTEAKFDFGVAMLPAGKQRGTPTGGGNFYVFRKASPEERKAAVTFIKWMTSPERAAQWSIGTGYVGVTRAAYETPALKKYVADFPAAAVARDQFQYAVAEFAVHENARVKKLLDDAIQAVLTGSKEPRAALAEAQAQAERILDRYRR
ncbi:MAG TPA: ABC transporter substrate-binding protein [Candidatus Tectomicrobia bacterium]|nr:ABC transporter substrate-binding protein [Candidatus Tectomicrobia bacterium]